jgi:hypothetical protein
LCAARRKFLACTKEKAYEGKAPSKVHLGKAMDE